LARMHWIVQQRTQPAGPSQPRDMAASSPSQPRKVVGHRSRGGEQGSFDAKGVNVGPNIFPAMFCDFVVTLAGATAGPT
jgi:hypothetical protein